MLFVLFWSSNILSATPTLPCVLQCSVTCGEGVRRREVKCIRNKHRTVDVSECRNATRPALVEACTLQECTRFQWVTAPWSKVRLLVGDCTPQWYLTSGRFYTRYQWKEFEQAQVPFKRKIVLKRKVFSSDLLLSFFQCSQTCGAGKKLRKVSCVDTVTGQPIDDQLCEKEAKPRVARRCSKIPCPFMWITGDWTQVRLG